MAEKPVVQWQASYSVGVKLIDDQHMELVKLTNKLFANCMAGRERARNTFLDTIHEAVEYVGYHFGTEEKVMERINYPEFAIHKKQHENFVREVFVKVEEFNAGKTLAPLSFVYYLRDWVLHHIAVCDKKYGDYLRQMHQSGELQKITLKAKEEQDSSRTQRR